MRARRSLLAVHGGYYCLTGIWPLVSRRSFERVTGSKADFWLVQTVGLLIGSIGVGLGKAARRPAETAPELATVAVLSAAGLALIDIRYVLSRRIRPIYLADAVVEAVLIASWLRTKAR